MDADARNEVDLTSRHLHTMWWLFFFIYAGIGANLTFLNVYYVSEGLSGVQVGLIGLSSSAAAMLGATFWGFLSDRTGRAPRIMIAGAVAAAGISLIYLLAHQFWTFLFLGTLFSFFNTSFTTLADSTTLTMLGERREEYGRYRLGGTFGYILVTAVAGFVFERTGLRWMFPAYSVIMLVFILVARRLPALSLRANSQHICSLGAMMRQRTWIIFALCSFLIWLAMSGTMNYLGVTIKAMGGGDSLVGIAATMSAVTEIPFMFFSGRIMRRFGQRSVLWASMLFYTLRIGLYGMMPNPYWAAGINMLNGPTYVFFWNSAVTYANQMAPPSLKATAQGIFQATTNLASMVGALLCGWMFDAIGPASMFRVLAMSCLAAFIIFGLSHRRAQPATA